MRCSPQAPLASEASSSLPRGWWRTGTVIRGGVEDPVTCRVRPHVSVHGLRGHGHDAAVRHESPLPIGYPCPRCVDLSLGLLHAAEHGVLLGPRDVAQEPGVHLGEVHLVQLGPGDLVGGHGRELLERGGHHGDKPSTVILGHIRNSIALHHFIIILFFIIRILVT